MHHLPGFTGVSHLSVPSVSHLFPLSGTYEPLIFSFLSEMSTLGGSAPWSGPTVKRVDIPGFQEKRKKTNSETGG